MSETSTMSNNKAQPQSVKNIREEELYPLVKVYLESQARDQNLQVTTITQTTSTKKGSDMAWSHPDIVAIQDPYLHSEARAVIEKIEPGKQKLVSSYEVKKDLKSGRSLKESFFQALSNSSWAHEGYLVAETIDDNAKTELQRLSTTYGIGVIQLNCETPKDSHILFPAKTKDSLDWDFVNKLSENNSFKAWLKRAFN